MSNLFYDYLRDRIKEYFNNILLEEGMKYNLSFEDEEQVKEMYKSFEKLKTNTFIYENYETIEIHFKDKALIIAGTITGITPDYMIKLRNLISEEKSLFKNKAILFLHNSTLDSLIGGSESLTKAGLPLNIKNIEKDIKKKAEKLNLKDKEIINFSLQNFINSSDSALNLFEFEDILKVLVNKKINLEDYIKFDLMPDPELIDYKDEKEIKKRIKENHEIFKMIDFAKKYDDIETLKETFDENIIKKLKNDEEIEITYSMLKKSKDKKADAKHLTYKEGPHRIEKNGIIYWEKPDGITKASKRKINILIFNPNKVSEMELSFSFEEKINLSYLKKINEKISEVKASGSTLKIKLKMNELIKYEVIKFGTVKDMYEFKFLIVNIPENYLENLKEKWILKHIKKQTQIFIITDKKELKFNENHIERNIELDDQKEEIIECSLEESLNLKFSPCENDIFFKININNNILNFVYKDEEEKINEITGIDLWILKNQYQKNFYFIKENFKETKKIIFENKEYSTKKELQNFILMEQEIIKSEGLYFKRSYSGELYSQELKNIPINLYNKYIKIIKYFKNNKTIPSFTYINFELKELYSNYVKEFFKAVENGDLENKFFIKDLMNLGKIIEENNDHDIYLTPLHPLNILYQLELLNNINNIVMPYKVSKHLKSTNLLPYIYNKNILYKSFDHDINLEWKIYSSDLNQKYNSSKEYVKKLVKGKIKEFKNHFSYLFELNNNCPLKINLINMGYCEEILIGIFDYIKSEIKDKTKSEITPIEINIYSKTTDLTIFEKVNVYRTAQEIEENLKIKLKYEKYTSEEILELYREKVKFCIKENWEIEYNHITFYEMDKSLTSITYDNMNNLNTGLALNGIISSLLPNYIGQSYKNGFGIKGTIENNLIKLSKIYNSIVRVAENQDPYSQNDVIVISVLDEEKKKLNDIYNNSCWVTFIDPKVDINFFKEEDKEIIIIHYSSQYTPNSNYDSITVTKNTQIYKDVLANELEYNLKIKNKDNINKFSKDIIHQFNSINGEWLLKFSRINNKEIPIEKISILSSIKYGLKLLKSLDSNIIWIPLSLEEVLRVTGSAELSQKEGILSARNLEIIGKCTDDLIFFGIDCRTENINLLLYPVEVKIGKNTKSIIDNAIDQCSHLINKLEYIFMQKDFINQFYRTLFMQTIYSAIEKYIIYNFGEKDEWKKLLESNVKSKLLNDNYQYVNIFNDKIGKYGIFSFDKDNFNRTEKLISKFDKDNNEISHLLVELPEKDGYDYIIDPGHLENIFKHKKGRE